jgi:hypothetical protein
MQRHRVLDVLTHVDPWRRPDRDHDRGEAAAAVAARPAQPNI